MQPVIAFVGVESRLADKAADIGAVVQPQPRRAFLVGYQVGLADNSGGYPFGSQIIAQGQFPGQQRNMVPCRAVAEDGAPGVK